MKILSNGKLVTKINHIDFVTISYKNINNIMNLYHLEIITMRNIAI